MSVPAYYIPARETTDPANVADALSENLSTGYGSWFVVKPEFQSLSIDTGNKVVRNGALHVGRGFDSGWHNGPESVDAFYFSFPTPIDLSDMQSISFLIHTFDRHYDNPNFTVPILYGQNTVSFNDVNGIAVYSPFFTNMTDTKQWTTVDANSPRQYMKSDFTGATNFDWTRVKSITYYIGLKAIDPTDVWAPNGYDIWIDGGPFIIVQGEAIPVIQIQCEDEKGSPIPKKNTQFYNYGINANSPLEIPTTLRLTAGNYGIEAKDADFLHWGDGDTARLKNFTVLASGNITLKAVYAVQTNLDLTLPLIAGAIVIGGVLIYLIRK